MTRHHAFSLEVCVHDSKTAEFVRIKLAQIREAIGEDVHVFRITETHQTSNDRDDEDEGQPVAAVHLAS